VTGDIVAAEIFAKYLPNFLFILLRTSIVMSFLPIFSSKNLPLQFKVGFVVVISLVLSTVVEVNASLQDLPFFVVHEILFGIVFGMAARAVFMAVEMAGQIMSNVMGLSIATAFNPEMGQSTEVARFFGLVTVLVFLTVDGHHDLIYAFVKSYEILQPGSIQADGLIQRAIAGGSNLFIMALKISAPVLIIMFILNMVLGFIYKAAPQMNIFFIGYPVFIFVGFFVMLICIPAFINLLVDNFAYVREELSRVLALARG
jgi:flagellar biosynthetic protein FliR